MYVYALKNHSIVFFARSKIHFLFVNLYCLFEDMEHLKWVESL